MAASTWRWQELKQRAIDGCFSTADMGCVSLHEYSDWDGAHITIPHGYQVRGLKCVVCGFLLDMDTTL